MYSSKELPIRVNLIIFFKLFILYFILFIENQQEKTKRQLPAYPAERGVEKEGGSLN